MIGVVQVGFSLARTLNTYIGDYKDSRDSIISLAAELDATIIQVKELNSFVESNKSSKVLGEGSLKLAEKCTKDSDRLVKRLVELLTKARLPDDPAAIVNIKPEDIVVSRLTRAYWPLVKPQVEVVRSELHVMKTDILLARSCIQSQTGSTPADRAAGDESIVAHAKSLQLARQLLRKAKAEEQRSTMSRVPEPPPRHVRILDDYPRVSDDDQGVAPRIPPPIRRSTGLSTGGEHGGALADRLAREIRDDIANDLARKEKELKDREAAEEETRKMAVEVYQKTLKEQFTRLQARSEGTQRQMKEIFGSTLDERQLQRFLEEQQSQHMQDELGEMLLKLGVGPSSPQAALPKEAPSSADSKESGSSRRRYLLLWITLHLVRLLTRNRWRFGRRSSRSTSHSRYWSDVTSNSRDSLDIGDSKYEYVEGIVRFDATDHYWWDWHPIRSSTIQHQPCGSVCDLQPTLTVLHSIPQSVRQNLHGFINWKYGTGDGDYGPHEWRLHAAVCAKHGAHKSRSFLKRAILGTTLYQRATDTLVVYCRPRREEELVDDSSEAPPRVELSRNDVDQMRTWMSKRGMSTAKIDELEAQLARNRHIPQKSGQPDPNDANQASGNDPPVEDEAYGVNDPTWRPSNRTIEVVTDGAAAFREQQKKKLDDELADELAEMRRDRRRRSRSRGRSSASSRSSDGRLHIYHDRRARGEDREDRNRDGRQIEAEIEIRERFRDEANSTRLQRTYEAANKRIAEQYEKKQREAEIKAKEEELRQLVQLNRERREPRRSRWDDDDGYEEIVVRDRYPGMPATYDYGARTDRAGPLVIREYDRRRARSPTPPPPPPPPDWYNPGGQENFRPYQPYEIGSRLSPIYEQATPVMRERTRRPDVVTTRSHDYNHYVPNVYDDYRESESAMPWPLPRPATFRANQEDTEDADDADLDDEQLKTKMLVRYTGGGLNTTPPPPPVSCQRDVLLFHIKR